MDFHLLKLFTQHSKFMSVVDNTLYNVEIKQDTYGFYVIEVSKKDTGELVYYQDINPKTGEKIKSEEEAKEVIKELFSSLLENVYQVFLNIDVLVFDEETGKYIKKPIIKVGEKVKLNFELYKINELGEKELLENLNGKYIVPYLRIFGKLKNIFSEKFLLPFLKFIETSSSANIELNKFEILNQDVDVLEGAVLIEVKNGKGSFEMIMKKSGFYKIDPDLIINTETLQPVQPKPKTEGDIVIIVVE